MFSESNFKFYTYCRVGKVEQAEEIIDEVKIYEGRDYREIHRGDSE